MKKREQSNSNESIESDAKYTLEKDGFVGELFLPSENEYLGKAVIMISGSDGSFTLTKLLASKYAEHGIPVLALAYWNQAGLPDSFDMIPIDYIEKAALLLHQNGFKKIGLWGISMGAELALLSASLLPDLITSVVAVSPINVSTQGFKKKPMLKLLQNSSWSFHNEEVPYQSLEFSVFKVLLNSTKDRSINLRACYENAIKNGTEEAQIKVENINGPILLLYPKYDPMWPSELAAEKIISRLQDKKRRYPVIDKSYQYASHMLVPYELGFRKMFKIERQYPEECMKSNMDSLEETLKFWKEYW